MNGLRLLAALLFFATLAEAQQLSLFTQYREQATILNPAAITSDYLAFGQNVTLGASYRVQWVDFAGAPTTQTLHGSYMFAEPAGVNLLAGGHIINDQTGPTGFTGIYGRIGGLVSGDPYYGGLSLGLSAGLVQYRVDGSAIRLRDPNDVVSAVGETQLYPDLGAGVFAYKRMEGRGFFNGDVLYGGISVPQVLGLDLTFRGTNGDFYTQRVQHFYGMLGLYKFLREENTFLEPSIWFRYAPNAPASVDFNLRYQMTSNFWIGSGVSMAGTFHMEGGVIIGETGYGNILKIGYGFDWGFNVYGPLAGSTHEIHVSYAFGN
jgi:type IX secretion system PorP/SprF family membrane protein